MQPAPQRLLDALLTAWRAEQNPGHSDLDNEQPISLHVRCTLGDLRTLALMRRDHDGGHGRSAATSPQTPAKEPQP